MKFLLLTLVCCFRFAVATPPSVNLCITHYKYYSLNETTNALGDVIRAIFGRNVQTSFFYRLPPASAKCTIVTSADMHAAAKTLKSLDSYDLDMQLKLSSVTKTTIQDAIVLANIVKRVKDEMYHAMRDIDLSHIDVTNSDKFNTERMLVNPHLRTI